MFLLFVFFFKQKTAYEMHISDWSSDVCSSDLFDLGFRPRPKGTGGIERLGPVAVLQQHRQGDMIGIGLDDMAQPFGFEEFVLAGAQKIGRASCRERVCQYV